MAALSDAQLDGLERLVASAPDAVLEALQASGEAGGVGPAAAMAEGELRERRAAALVFAPLLPPASGQWNLPPADIRRLWRTLDRAHPAEARRVTSAVARAALESVGAEPLDALCLSAAAIVRREPSSFAGLAVEPARLALALELAPVLRRALTRLPDWLGRNTGEGTALARLAYRDAARGSPEAGPLFLTILQGHLPEPWLILRVIASVMGRPTDRFVAGSELSGFGETVLADAAEAVAAVQAFAADPVGFEGEAAVHLQRALVQLEQFELAFDMARDGPWGERVTRLRRALAGAVESACESAVAAVAKALPLKRQPTNMKTLRGAPRLDGPPDVGALQRASVLVAFLAATGTALDGGYRAARARTVERLTERLAQYLDDLVERIHARDGEAETARAHLDAAAELYGLLTDRRTADASRRRAAAA
jgi:hypothetical protein